VLDNKKQPGTGLGPWQGLVIPQSSRLGINLRVPDFVLNSTEVGSLFKPGFPGCGEIPAPAGPAHLVTWSPVA